MIGATSFENVGVAACTPMQAAKPTDKPKKLKVFISPSTVDTRIPFFPSYVDSGPDVRKNSKNLAASTPCVRGGYTIGMKTAVSIPADVFESAERLARRTRKSRSQLYSEAVK